MSAASAAKKAFPGAEVVVLEKGPYISYAACSLPYYLAGVIPRIEDLVVLSPEVAKEERGIEVLTGHEAVGLDVKAQKVYVRTPQGEKSFPYDRLILATGGLPLVPPWPGVNLRGVFTLRTLQDGLAIEGFLREREVKRVAIVGGGYIGMEMAEAFRSRGLAVVVLEKADRVLGTMDEEITSKVEGELRSQGVRLEKGVTVQGFEGSETVKRVVTDKGDFDVDMVLLAIGVRPNSALARDAGIALGVRDAVAVDEHLETSVPGVFAAGDCAETFHVVTSKKAYIPLGTTANRQGRMAGENAAGSRKVFPGVVGTAMTKVFRLQVGRTGLSSLEAQGEGMDFVKVTIEGRSRAHACPQGRPLWITYVVERTTGKLLGAQMVGEEGVAHRINTLAAAVQTGMTVEEISRLDLGYAPPFATVWDPILIAANVAAKRLGGR